MRARSILLASALATMAPLALAAFPPAAPATQPAADAAEIPALIRQLGDDRFAVRQEAYARLHEIGKDALPALRDATASDDTEVQVRARELIADIEPGPIPHDLPQPLPVPGNGGVYSESVRTEQHGAIQTIDVSEGGRLVHIERAGAAIRMVVAGQIGGKPATREYRAPSSEALKAANPEAFDLYRTCLRASMDAVINGRFANGNFPRRQRFMPFVPPGGAGMMPIVPIPRQRAVPVPPANEDLDRLQSRLAEQMRDANLTNLQRNHVLDLLRQLRNATPPAGDPVGINDRIEEYNRRSDALREQLKALGLPDPGDTLPPVARLGVSVTDEFIHDQGVCVTHVLPHSRADRLGMREQDYVQKINGKPIHTAHDLRNIVNDHPKGLVIEGTRAGKPIKLEEKN